MANGQWSRTVAAWTGLLVVTIRPNSGAKRYSLFMNLHILFYRRIIFFFSLSFFFLARRTEQISRIIGFQGVFWWRTVSIKSPVPRSVIFLKDGERNARSRAGQDISIPPDSRGKKKKKKKLDKRRTTQISDRQDPRFTGTGGIDRSRPSSVFQVKWRHEACPRILSIIYHCYVCALLGDRDRCERPRGYSRNLEKSPILDYRFAVIPLSFHGVCYQFSGWIWPLHK